MATRQWVGAVALAALIVSTGADAFGGPGGRGGSKRDFFDPARMARLAERLDLTEAQRDRIDDLAASARRASRDHIDALVGVRRELRAQVREGSFDEAVIRRLAKEKASHEEELMVIRVRSQANFRAVLTEDQLGQLPKRARRKAE